MLHCSEVIPSWLNLWRKWAISANMIVGLDETGSNSPDLNPIEEVFAKVKS